MIKNRGNNIVVKSQFNISGSRGKSVKPFITNYVSRDSACDPSTAYISPTGVIEHGDGVGFTLDQTAISREEVLRIADDVERFFQEGDRAIQQMVISFSHDYLVEQGIVDKDAVIMKRGDYRHQYDDVRLRHAVRSGVQAMVDLEGYRDPQMVAAVQHDTLHLHVHAVVYENYHETSPNRQRGKEERGMIKPSSFNQLTYEMDRKLTNTKRSEIPNEKKLRAEHYVAPEPQRSDIVVDMTSWTRYLEIMMQLEKERKEREEQTMVEETETLQTEINLDNFMFDFYANNAYNLNAEEDKRKKDMGR